MRINWGVKSFFVAIVGSVLCAASVAQSSTWKVSDIAISTSAPNQNYQVTGWTEILVSGKYLLLASPTGRIVGHDLVDNSTLGSVIGKVLAMNESFILVKYNDVQGRYYSIRYGSVPLEDLELKKNLSPTPFSIETPSEITHFEPAVRTADSIVFVGATAKERIFWLSTPDYSNKNLPVTKVLQTIDAGSPYLLTQVGDLVTPKQFLPLVSKLAPIDFINRLDSGIFEKKYFVFQSEKYLAVPQGSFFEKLEFSEPRWRIVFPKDEEGNRLKAGFWNKQANGQNIIAAMNIDRTTVVINFDTEKIKYFFKATLEGVLPDDTVVMASTDGQSVLHFDAINDVNTSYDRSHSIGYVTMREEVPRTDGQSVFRLTRLVPGKMDARLATKIDSSNKCYMRVGPIRE